MYDPDELLAVISPHYPLTREQAVVLCEELNKLLRKELDRMTEELDRMVEEALRRHTERCPVRCREQEPEMGSEEWRRLRSN